MINLRRGTPGQVPPPVDDIAALASHAERAGVDQALKYSFVGTAETVQRALQRFTDTVKPDELMLTGLFYDYDARLRSFEVAAQVCSTIAPR